ncbi:MAG: hypothetical protein U5K27_19145 [Desulfotignum sp.]|nr:hypothetical protein [Desulfotignum sp.]
MLLLFSIVYERIAGRMVPDNAADLYNELARIMGIIAGVVLILFVWRTIIGGISSTSDDLRAFRHMIGSLPYHIELWLGLAASYPDGHAGAFRYGGHFPAGWLLHQLSDAGRHAGRPHMEIRAFRREPSPGPRWRKAVS